jgi:hypothetical protein
LATKAQRIVMTFGGWAFFVLATLLIFNVLSLEFYFMLCLIGFLVIVHMSGPFISRPKWRSRLNWFIVASIIIFFLIVIGKVLDILKIRLF